MATLNKNIVVSTQSDINEVVCNVSVLRSTVNGNVEVANIIYNVNSIENSFNIFVDNLDQGFYTVNVTCNYTFKNTNLSDTVFFGVTLEPIIENIL
jgi:hypothetical protein